MNKFSRKKLFKLAIVITSIVFFVLITNYKAFASTLSSQLDDLYSQKSNLNQEIKDNKAAAEEKAKQAKNLTNTIETLSDNISETEAKMSETETQISSTEKEITETQQKIKAKEAELAKENENKNNTLREIYKGSKLSTWELLISVENLSDAINNSRYFESLETRLETTINEISKLKSDMENKKSELEKKKAELANLKGEQQAYKKSLESQKQEKDVVLKDTKIAQKEYEEQVAEAKKLSSQVQSQIASIQASMKNSTGVLPRDRGTSSVGFSWPMNYKYISCTYGESTPFQSFHSGLDLVNIQGTPVYAAGDGTVITVKEMTVDGHYYGYGKYVVIGHNARYSSLYGHLMDYTVSPGQEVKRGDVIGYEGSTGWSTGPHLHFEIWDNGSRVNPVNYLP